MQSRQDKTYGPDAANQDLEKKVPPGSAAPARLPAWASSWGENLAPGLINPLANLQAKGVVSQPGDPYEQEADQVADQVMGMAAPGASMISAPVDPPGASPRLATPAYHVSPMIQRATVEENTPSPMAADSAPTPDAGTSASAQTADASALPSPQSGIAPTEASTAGLIVDDSADQLQPGQMKKSDFLAQLRDAVCATTEEALKGTIWSAAGCPWVGHWFGYYGNRDSQQIERALRRYAPETASATSAGDYIPIICGRVRNAIAVWSTTGEVAGVPEGMELPGAGLMGAVGSIASGIASVGSSIASGVESVASGIASAGASLVSGAGSALSSVGSMLFKGREGGAREANNPQVIQGQLGSGRSLDGGVRSHMESAFGVDFSQVRVHTDATAAGLSENLNARAFTVGQDVAFGTGEYRPGTLVGDALIAHELAHVVQQGGADSSEPMQKGETTYDTLEEDADRSAVGAMVSLWSGAKGGLVNVAQHAMPAMRSRLGLQRCAGRQKQPVVTPQQPVPQQPVPQQPIAQAEWNTHPHIQSRYNTWQAYESVRNRVAGWRNPPVADPASYIDSAIVEWNANPGMHRDFDNNFDGDPHRSYLNLKRLYQNRGINNPANFLATNIVNITFYNRRTPGHTDLQVALNNAQTAMTAAGHTFVLDAGTWSYVPRTFNNNINSLSNHALGKAIDINPGNNPHITSSEDFLVINTLCSPVIPHGLLAETNYANLKSASDFFQQHFDDTWVSNQEHLLTQMQGQHPPPPNLQAQQRLVNAIHHRRAMLNGYAARGFLNLPADLVAGLQGAGLSWGGEWHTAKDFMHFELPNP